MLKFLKSVLSVASTPCPQKWAMLSQFPVPQNSSPQQFAASKSETLGLFFSDILVPMPTTSPGGQHFASFFDIFSSFWVVYFMKSKNGYLEILKIFCSHVGKLKLLRTNNGIEYPAETFADFWIKGDKIIVHCFKCAASKWCL